MLLMHLWHQRTRVWIPVVLYFIKHLFNVDCTHVTSENKAKKVSDWPINMSEWWWVYWSSWPPSVPGDPSSNPADVLCFSDTNVIWKGEIPKKRLVLGLRHILEFWSSNYFVPYLHTSGKILKYGPNPATFCLFSSFSPCDDNYSTSFWTLDCRMVDAYESTELWRPHKRENISFKRYLHHFWRETWVI